ncbi:MAG: hypothetical protein LBU76_09450, partial [Azoarcus sp.]|nr:hypothetical protein [Azoarcus sp.]
HNVKSFFIAPFRFFPNHPCPSRLSSNFPADYLGLVQRRALPKSGYMGCGGNACGHAGFGVTGREKIMVARVTRLGRPLARLSRPLFLQPPWPATEQDGLRVSPVSARRYPCNRRNRIFGSGRGGVRHRD